MAPVKNEEDEMNENVPKLLCQMDNHFGGFDAIFFVSFSRILFSCSSSSMFELIIMMIIKMMMTMMMVMVMVTIGVYYLSIHFFSLC